MATLSAGLCVLHLRGLITVETALKLEVWARTRRGRAEFRLLLTHEGRSTLEAAIGIEPEQARGDREPSPIRSIAAITLATHDMARAVRFYRTLGFILRYGGEDASFTSFTVGPGYLNLVTQSAGRRWSWWGRVIYYVQDVDALHARALRLGLRPQAPPRDAEWGERYFHLTDPDGHELSFAQPIGAGG